MDTEWDMKGFAFLDPTGENNMNNENRDVRLTNLQFVEQRLLNVNTNFASCLSFLYACLAHIENLQLTSRINMSVQRGSKRKKADGGYEYGNHDAFQVFDSISNSIRLLKYFKYITSRKSLNPTLHGGCYVYPLTTLRSLVALILMLVWFRS